MIGSPGVVIKNRAKVVVGDGEVEPVDQQGLVRIAKGNVLHEAEGPAFPDDLGDSLALGLPLALREDHAVGVEKA